MIFFIENLTVSSWLIAILPYLLRHLKNIDRNSKIYFIDASKTGLFLSRFISLFFHIKLEELKFQMEDIRDESGNLLRERIVYFDFTKVQNNILNNSVFQDASQNSIIKNRMSVFLAKQTACFLHKSRKTIWRGLFLVQVALWKAKKEMFENKELVIFMDKRVWMHEIKQYAAQYNVRILPVNNIQIDPKSFLTQLLGSNVSVLKNMYFLFLKKTLPGFLGFLKIKHAKSAPINNAKENISQPRLHSSPKLAVEYYGHFNLNHPEFHSDFFFWQQSSLSGSDILITFSNSRDPIDMKKWDKIKKYNMSAVAMTPMATALSYAPFFYHWPKRNRITLPQSNLINRNCLIEQNWLSQQIRNYYIKLDYWVDFFTKYNIKAYITWYKYDASHCVIADALQSLGGITAIYQRAFEEFPSVETIIYCDVVFSFTSKTAEIERLSGSRIPYYVATGYFGDHRFPLLKEQALHIRRMLIQKGAKRIIAFFDENSSDDPRWHTGHEFMRANYEFLLDKVLANPWLGLVIKPKVPATLRKRLGPVARLLKQAEETGRCFVFEGGALQGSYPPAIAALASDIAIHGHLCAATAGMESALAGVPTLLLDREGWPISSLYKLGKGRVVFTDWQTLWNALKEHWNRPNGIPGFGDWSSVLEELDSFRDGRAAERIGTYLKWLMDGFKVGLAREKVLADAAERYSEKWGRDKIVKVN